MSDAAVQYHFKLIDEISGPLKQITASLRQTEQAMKAVKEQLNQLAPGFRDTQKATASLSRSTGNLQEKVAVLKTSMNRLGSSMISNTSNAQNFKSALAGVAGANNQVASSSSRAHGGVMSLGNAFHNMVAGVYLARHAIEGLEGVLRPAIEYGHQLNQLSMLGMKSQDIRKAQQTAFEVSQTVPTSTQKDVLSTIGDIRTVNKNFDLALKLAKPFEQMKTVMRASAPEGDLSNSELEQMALSTFKVAEMRGETNKFTDVKRNMDVLTNIFRATHGRVSPNLMAQIMKMSGAAAKGWDEEMLYTVAHFAQEMAIGKKGGGSRGIGPLFNQLYNMLIGGTMNKMTVASFEKMGLLPQHVGKLNTQTIRTQIAPHLKERELFIQDQNKWIQTVLRPAIEKTTGSLDKMNNVQEIAAITKSVPGLTTIQAKGMLEMLMPQNQRQIENLKSIAKAGGTLDNQYTQAMNDPAVGVDALRKSFERFAQELGSDKESMTALTDTMRAFRLTVDGITRAFHAYNLSERIKDFTDAYPNLARTIEDFGKTLSFFGGLVAGVAQFILDKALLIAETFFGMRNTAGDAGAATGDWIKNTAQNIGSALQRHSAGFVNAPGWKGGDPYNTALAVPAPPQGSGMLGYGIDGQPAYAAAGSAPSSWRGAPPPHAKGGITVTHNGDIHIHNPKDAMDAAGQFWQQVVSQTHHYLDSFTSPHSNRQAPANHGAQ